MFGLSERHGILPRLTLLSARLPARGSACGEVSSTRHWKGGLPLFRPRRRSSPAVRAVKVATTFRDTAFSARDGAMTAPGATTVPKDARSAEPEQENGGDKSIRHLPQDANSVSAHQSNAPAWAVAVTSVNRRAGGLSATRSRDSKDRAVIRRSKTPVQGAEAQFRR